MISDICILRKKDIFGKDFDLTLISKVTKCKYQLIMNRKLHRKRVSINENYKLNYYDLAVLD